MPKKTTESIKVGLLMVLLNRLFQFLVVSTHCCASIYVGDQVVFRVRPLNSKEKAHGRDISTIAHENKGVIELRNPSSEDSKSFTFDAVFSEKSTQRHIYDVSAAPVVQSVLEGYNGTVFVYGQTGAGKTHTMEGVNEPSSLRGIIPNTFEHIFDHIALNDSREKYLVRASYFEIYNEEIRDLLSQTPQTSLELKESANLGVYVKNLTSTIVKSVSEIDDVLQKGKKNRSVGATLMNAGSSRSHSIFSIVVECCQNEHIRVGKLNLVDLAGSERQSKTGATGDRLKEATKINLSLSALGNVISALVDGKSNHIPYRDSKLTRILQDSLGGNTKTGLTILSLRFILSKVMCANAGPADYNYDESLSTLRYANRAKNIKNRPVINEDPKDAMLREYQEEIARLKERLSQMPSSSPSPSAMTTVNDTDRETILEEARKESEETIAKTEAEMEKLKMNNHQTAEERAALQMKLDDEKKARKDTENQRLQLEKQLDEMEKQLMIGGEIANNAAKQEAALRKANQELIAKRESELALTRMMSAQEEDKLLLEDKYSSLAEEVTSKTRKLKKIWTKYQNAKVEIEDLEHEFLDEKNELLESIRDLTKQLKLKDFVISNFIPPRYAMLYDDVENGGRAVWDETKECWKIPELKLQQGQIKERLMTKQSLHRPESDYARRRKMVDPNPRYHTQDIVELDIAMPARSTPAYDDPNTESKIAAILAMDINDPLKELPSTNKNSSMRRREEKYLRVNDGAAKSSRSRRKKDKVKREGKSSRPTTARI
ncbi:hypothetical protein ACHAXR_006842 [Thalassiosira sp. AJA248-18]